MQRRKFLSNLSAKAVAIGAVSGGLIALEHYGPEIVLPGINGPLRVREMTHRSLISPAYAQYYYNYNMAPYQQWLAYQQAQYQYMLYLQQLQANMAWLQQQHIAAMQAAMARHQNHQIGQPQAWEGARSIYAYARSGGETVYIGANANSQEVMIKDTLPAAEKVFSRLSANFSRADRERAIGPQADERPVAMALPDGSTTPATAHKTRTGNFAVSDSDRFVDGQGRKGQVAKFEIGPGGHSFEVV